MKLRDKVIGNMLGSEVRNYIIPGLDSYLLENGQVRMFKSSRDHAGEVTPHSHRFDFTCYVLQGIVINKIYKPVSPFGDGSDKKLDGDTYTARSLSMTTMGEYRQIAEDKTANYMQVSSVYQAGDWYSMTYMDIHSISFGKDTQVLFFEGPDMVKHHTVLLPRIRGVTLETMKTEPWMFERDG